jgi:hypothetical protein
MAAIAWVRNGLIFAGIAAGGILAVSGAIAGKEETAEHEQEPVAATPILLNVARPPELGTTPLGNPLSLESPFGRSELTGIPVPPDPLEELDFDRAWDYSSTIKVPLPPADLPPEPATDEVAEPKHDAASLEEEPELDDLPSEARQRADAALASLRSGTKLLKEGMREFRLPGDEGREGSRKVKEAADLLRDARDKLESALKLAPQHPELLRLMQEAKANLYICMKHGM